MPTTRTEFIRETHPALDKWLYQFADSIVEGKPVARKVLELVSALTGFERGAVFIGDSAEDLELKVKLGSFEDIKVVRFLCARVLDIRPNEIEVVPDRGRLNEGAKPGLAGSAAEAHLRQE